MIASSKIVESGYELEMLCMPCELLRLAEPDSFSGIKKMVYLTEPGRLYDLTNADHSLRTDSVRLTRSSLAPHCTQRNCSYK